ncbi:MAG: thioredoxin family protein [Comamonadaceae bacterium]|nr:thioredoxin family protein [Comamonadaceae bacterium]
MADSPATALPPGTWTVACLCAAWCRTCDAVRPHFEARSAAHAGIAHRWIDIEDEADALGDLDIETFPTLLVVRDGVPLFFGPAAAAAAGSRCAGGGADRGPDAARGRRDRRRRTRAAAGAAGRPARLSEPARARAPRPRMRSLARSAIITTGALVLPETSVGITEASTTRSPSTPRTRSCGSTTASASDAHAAGAGRVVDGVGAAADRGADLVVAAAPRRRRARARGRRRRTARTPAARRCCARA